MTNLPDDLIDPAEARLTRRVGSYTDQAVFPIDPVAIAASAAVAGRRRSIGERLFGGAGAAARLAVVGGVAVLAIAGFGVVITGGAGGLFAPRATVTPATVAVRWCTPNEVDAVITNWDGAAGNRIATVELRHIGTVACSVEPMPQPWLADKGGAHLIDGKAGTGAPITFGPGDVLYTLVDASNYCGPDPKAPVMVAFTQGDVAQDPPPANAALFVATALTPGDLTGVPPCNGPGQPGSIQMHPWSATAP
jgi:hypothetical protein